MLPIVDPDNEQQVKAWTRFFRKWSPTFRWSDDAKHAACRRAERRYAGKSDNERKMAVKKAKGRILRKRNTMHLGWGMAIVAALIVIDVAWRVLGAVPILRWIPVAVAFVVSLLGFIYALSRGLEVFAAFFMDAVNQTKSGNRNKGSDLQSWERVQLALKSYIELIFDFTAAYYFLALALPEPNMNTLHWLYVSGATMTTLGAGSGGPSNIVGQLLTVFQVGIGILLLVVAFALYIARPDQGDASR